jgi:HEPN domain-containing protein
MNPLTVEWVEKAEGDFIVAQKMLIARKSPVYDAVCFHAQQCAEKYLKAFLQENTCEIPKTHKLLDLLKLCKERDYSLEFLLPDLIEVERFSVNVRYPGTSTDKEDAKLAYRATEVIRQFLRQKLGL